MSRSLLKEIRGKFSVDSSASNFLDNLMSISTVYLFGGAIRDFFDNSLDSSRDFDFVIETRPGISIDYISLCETLDNVQCKKNRYDGYKIIFNNLINVDVWNLEDTWAFRTKKLKPSANNLLKSVYLNIDALVFSLNSNTFLDNCDSVYMNIRKNHLIDIVFEETPFEELNLLRALVLQKKYSYNLSTRLSQRLKSNFGNDVISAIEILTALQKAHYKKEVLDEYELTSILHHLG